MLLRIERLVALFGADVSEDNIGVDVGIEVLHAAAISFHSICKRRNRLGVTGVSAAAIIGRATLSSITVDIHICKLAVGTLDINDLRVL